MTHISEILINVFENLGKELRKQEEKEKQAMFNQQNTIVGNLGRSPEVRYTQNGVAVATLSVGVYGGKDKDGNSKTIWYNVKAFKALAENIGNRLTKGQRVICIGRMSTNTVKDDNGKNITYWEMVADEVGEAISSFEAKANVNESNFAKMGAVDDSDIPF